MLALAECRFDVGLQQIPDDPHKVQAPQQCFEGVDEAVHHKHASRNHDQRQHATHNHEQARPVLQHQQSYAQCKTE